MSQNSDKAIPVILASNALQRLWPVSTANANYALKGIDGQPSPLQNLMSSVKRRGKFGKPIILVQEQAVKQAVAQIKPIFGEEVTIVATRSDISSGVLASLAARIQSRTNLSPALVIIPATLATPDERTLDRYLDLMAENAQSQELTDEICFLTSRKTTSLKRLRFQLDHQPTRAGLLPIKQIISAGNPDADCDISTEQSLYVYPVGPVIARASAITRLLAEKAQTVLQACSHAVDTGEKIGNVLRPNVDFLTLASQISLTDVIINSPSHARILMCGDDLETVRDWSSRFAVKPKNSLLLTQVVGSAENELISYEDRLLAVNRNHYESVTIAKDERQAIVDHHVSGRTIERIESQQGAAVWKIRLEPGQRLDNECHFQRIESWNIISGRGTAYLDDQPTIVEPGATIIISPETCHQIENTGDEPLVFYEMRLGRMMDDDDRLSIPSKAVEKMTQAQPARA